MLVVDLLPFEHSTRSRKIAETMSARGWRVRFVGLSRAGRLGIASPAGRYSVQGVEVEHIAVGNLRMGDSWTGSARNLAFTYLPALVRMTRRVMGDRDDTVVIGHMSLVGLGVAHRIRYGSRLILNARERLGGIRTRGSLGTLFSILEPSMLRVVALDPGVTVIAVADSHASEYAALGRWSVVTVRNVPKRGFGGEFIAPPPLPPLRLCLVGSLYPGRGVIPLLNALGRAVSEDLPVHLRLVGRSAPGFLGRIEDAILANGLSDNVEVLGPCDPDEVADHYKMGHVGLALYEATDSANDSLSNKIFEIAAAGRPVLAGDLPENRALVSSARIGWVFPVTTEGLYMGIRTIWDERTSLVLKARHVVGVANERFVWEKELDAAL